MATFSQRITGLTSVDIIATSNPTTAEVTQFLTDACKDITNKITQLRPDEAFKFASTTSVSDGNGTNVTGKILSVVRENGSSSDVRPATMIPDSLRYLATDKSSLHYRSAYNPCFYVLDKKIYVLPAPADSDTQALISMINYVGAGATDESIVNFPDEYEDLVVLYGAAKTCQAAASDIQNNMPAYPIAPDVTGFEDIKDVSLPAFPVYAPSNLGLQLTDALESISNEDFDKADKNLEIVSKEIESFKANNEVYNMTYNKDLENFNKDLDNAQKDMDRKSQVVTSEFRSKIYKYQYEITQYSQELQEKFTKYKWFVEQYIYFMNEYNQGLQLAIGQQRAPKQEAPKRVKEEKQRGEE
mgnify:CR=1 FL=1